MTQNYPHKKQALTRSLNAPNFTNKRANTVVWKTLMRWNSNTVVHWISNNNAWLMDPIRSTRDGVGRFVCIRPIPCTLLLVAGCAYATVLFRAIQCCPTLLHVIPQNLKTRTGFYLTDWWTDGLVTLSHPTWERSERDLRNIWEPSERKNWLDRIMMIDSAVWCALACLPPGKPCWAGPDLLQTNYTTNAIPNIYILRS